MQYETHHKSIEILDIELCCFALVTIQIDLIYCVLYIVHQRIHCTNLIRFLFKFRISPK